MIILYLGEAETVDKQVCSSSEGLRPDLDGLEELKDYVSILHLQSKWRLLLPCWLTHPSDNTSELPPSLNEIATIFFLIGQLYSALPDDSAVQI